MLSTISQRKQKILWMRIALFVACASCFMPVFAADAVTSLSAQDMIKNFANQVPSLMRFITAFAYVMGMYFIVYGIFKLKQYGEARTMMTSQHQLKGPLIYITIGAMLLYLPASVSIGLSSFWTNPTPYGYKLNQDEWAQFYNQIFLVIQFIGTIAFIRGLVMLTKLADHGQPGAFGKALTHIVGGIFCINIYEFIQVVFATLGISVNS